MFGFGKGSKVTAADDKAGGVKAKKFTDLTSAEGCERAISYGWILALISAGFSIIVIVIGLITASEDETFIYLSDPWSLFDVVFFIALAFFVRKKSRAAATTLFIFFVIGKLLAWYTLGTVQGLPVTLIFAYVHFNAMRATFVWHSKFKTLDTSSL